MLGTGLAACGAVVRGCDTSPSIAVVGGGGYELVFADGGSSRTLRSDFVVLAIPFSKLHLVDTARLALPEVKRRLIREFAYGTMPSC